MLLHSYAQPRVIETILMQYNGVGGDGVGVRGQILRTNNDYLCYNALLILCEHLVRVDFNPSGLRN